MTTSSDFYTVWTPRVQALLRIVVAILFFQHGLAKLFPAAGGNAVPLMSLFGAAAILELVGGFLIFIGLFTRPTAFILSGEMAFAYFIAHAPHGFNPIANQGELAVIYCFVFLFFAVAGAGAFSVDAARKKA
jgi:putative oxidoreductase